jgi:hypothetical protein
MLVAIYDAAGDLVIYMDAGEDQIALNIPDGGRFEEVPRERMMPPPKPAEEPPT